MSKATVRAGVEAALVLACAGWLWPAGAPAASQGDDKSRRQVYEVPPKVGLRIESKLAVTDARDKVRKASFCKVYLVLFASGKTYTIRHLSKGSTHDPYLRLEDPDGKNLAEDDDGDGGLNSRITFACPKDGVYRVIITSLDGNATGDFTLLITSKP
jgi:hypothetical protein